MAVGEGDVRGIGSRPDRMVERDDLPNFLQANLVTCCQMEMREQSIGSFRNTLCAPSPPAKMIAICVYGLSQANQKYSNSLD
ncbi:hypothetical protein ABZ864_43040 [Streptomyces sp. NPDC047082]|uniref:hypothetical protein n=1 Tax=Streptomyces sp. NPDC047082 TaxID=3155259 RepID=UPI0033F41444